MIKYWPYVKIQEKGRHMACFAKRKIDGCTLCMKRDGLFTSGIVGNETTYMGYVKQELCSI